MHPCNSMAESWISSVCEFESRCGGIGIGTGPSQLSVSLSQTSVKATMPESTNGRAKNTDEVPVGAKGDGLASITLRRTAGSIPALRRPSHQPLPTVTEIDMSEALVIIDMQRYFGPIPQYVTTNVVREINRAKDLELPIVVLRFRACGSTTDKVKRAVKDYPLAFFATKKGADGSTDVKYAIVDLQDPPKQVRVCGLYTTRCVADTVDGLIRKGFCVTVVADACYDDDGCGHDEQIEQWLEDGVRVS